MWLLLSLDNSIQIFSPDKGRKNQDESKRTMIRFKPHVD